MFSPQSPHNKKNIVIGFLNFILGSVKTSSATLMLILSDEIGQTVAVGRVGMVLIIVFPIRVSITKPKLVLLYFHKSVLTLPKIHRTSGSD